MLLKSQLPLPKKLRRAKTMTMITLMTTTTTSRIINWMIINSRMTTIKVTKGDSLITRIINRTLSRNVIKKIKTRINKMKKKDLERELFIV
jgi:hypothetical protein